LKFLIPFLLFIQLYALNIENEKYSLRVAYGYASEKNLGDILLFGDFSHHPRTLNVIALDGGYLLKKDVFSLPLDIYIKNGLSYFNEDKFRDTFEIVFYAKAYLNLDFLDNRVRIGAGEGISYTKGILESEMVEAIADKEPTSRFLNYLDISLDFDLGRLLGYKPMYDAYLGYALKHRSGVFGLYNGVHGGSNYNTFYLEKNF